MHFRSVVGNLGCTSFLDTVYCTCRLYKDSRNCLLKQNIRKQLSWLQSLLRSSRTPETVAKFQLDFFFFLLCNY
jgi:hypothetical protein